tara:strand:- start:241 stop:414 length:174 start_codon:yes stop_codon:yes gene_type:complete
MELKTYSEKEIQSALSVLSTRLYNKKLDRKELNQEIAALRKNIALYEDMDTSQYRID